MLTYICTKCTKAFTVTQIPPNFFSSWWWTNGCSPCGFCGSNLSYRLYPEVREGTAKPRGNRGGTRPEPEEKVGIETKQKNLTYSWS